jgi:hypothetical protein
VKVSHEEALRRGWIQPDAMPALTPRPSSAGGTRPRTRTSKKEAEGTEQAQLIEMFRTRFPIDGFLLIHVPNGGFRKNAFEGWRLKQQGVRAGVSDLFLPIARGGYIGLWIEFKAAPPNDAPPTDLQLEWLELMREKGHRAELCLGVEAAFAVLLEYMALPPTIVMQP